jgi:heme O synthase-like polyprenyltransferase
MPSDDLRWARHVFGYSIVYLMILFGSLLVDHSYVIS